MGVSQQQKHEANLWVMMLTDRSGKLNNSSTLVVWELASSGQPSVEGLRQGQLHYQVNYTGPLRNVSGQLGSFVSAWWYGTLVLLWSTHQRRLLRNEFKPLGSRMSWPVTTLVVWDPRVFLVLSRGELLSTKAIFWVDVFQLTRIVSQKLKKRG